MPRDSAPVQHEVRHGGPHPGLSRSAAEVWRGGLAWYTLGRVSWPSMSLVFPSDPPSSLVDSPSGSLVSLLILPNATR